MSYENPAKRLLDLLLAGKKIDKNTKCKQAWSTLLQAEGEVELFRRLAHAMSLVPATREVLQAHYPRSLTSASHWMQQVTAGFTNQNLQSDWNSFLSYIDEHTVAYLTMTQDLLDARYVLDTGTDEKLADHRKVLDELLSDVLKSDQPQKLKQYLARALRRIIAALDEYHLTGGQAILDEVDAAIGRAVADPELRTQVKDSPAGTKFATALAAVANTFTIAAGAPALYGSLTKLLGG